MLFTQNTTATTVLTKVIRVKTEQVMVSWFKKKKLTGQSIVQHWFPPQMAARSISNVTMHTSYIPIPSSSTWLS